MTTEEILLGHFKRNEKKSRFTIVILFKIRKPEKCEM